MLRADEEIDLGHNEQFGAAELDQEEFENLRGQVWVLQRTYRGPNQDIPSEVIYGTLKDLVRRDLEANALSATNLRNQSEEWEQGASLILQFSSQDSCIDQHTRELAILIFKQVFKVLNHKMTSQDKVKVHAVICLQIAAKYEGKYDGTGYAGELGADLLNPTYLVSLFDGVAVGDILQAEIEILNCLDFRILFATPISIANQILHAADPSFDFSAVV